MEALVCLAASIHTSQVLTSSAKTARLAKYHFQAASQCPHARLFCSGASPAVAQGLLQLWQRHSVLNSWNRTASLCTPPPPSAPRSSCATPSPTPMAAIYRPTCLPPSASAVPRRTRSSSVHRYPTPSTSRPTRSATSRATRTTRAPATPARACAAT